MAQAQKRGHIYSRNSNPTVQAFEEKVRLLEGAEVATSFSSGVEAVSFSRRISAELPFWRFRVKVGTCGKWQG